MSRTLTVLLLAIAFFSAACCSKPAEKPMVQQQNAFDTRPRLIETDSRQLGDNVSTLDKGPRLKVDGAKVAMAPSSATMTIEELIRQCDELKKQLESLTPEQAAELEQRYRVIHPKILDKDRIVVGSRGTDVTCLEDEIQKAEERRRLEAEQKKQVFAGRFPQLVGALTKADVKATYGMEGDLAKITYSLSLWPRRYEWQISGSFEDAWLDCIWEERSWNEQHNSRKATYTDDPNDIRISLMAPRRTGTLAECVATLIDDVRSLRHK